VAVSHDRWAGAALVPPDTYFDRPDAFHALAPRGDEFFRVDVEIAERQP
jgi:hypothetical protein